jgi:hypothetical protein
VRRIDVLPAAGRIDVDAMFRDTYTDADGAETVVHEYSLRGVLSADAAVVRELVATPRVLPWPECPVAAGGAARLVGSRVVDIPRLVRAEFHGTDTCTHLNDLLRSLIGVPAMLGVLGRPPPPTLR